MLCMKTIISLQMMRLATRSLILCIGLWFLSAHLSIPAVAETIFSTPYTFTTLAGKANPANASNTDNLALFSHPRGLAVSADGDIYVANTCDHTICRITSAGGVTILAGRAGKAGSADGAGTDARFRYPASVAVDGTGNLYVADSGNNTIRRVTASGIVTTVAGLARLVGSADGTKTNALFNYPNSVAIDGAGNAYVADLYNFTVRKVTPNGVVTALAGQAGSMGGNDGKGRAARFNSPVGVAVDSAGNVYVADMDNNAIRRVTPTGVVTTLAGRLTYSVGSADGIGGDAQFYHPYGLAVDRLANVYVADRSNNTIRWLSPAGAV